MIMYDHAFSGFEESDILTPTITLTDEEIHYLQSNPCEVGTTRRQKLSNATRGVMDGYRRIQFNERFAACM